MASNSKLQKQSDLDSPQAAIARREQDSAAADSPKLDSTAVTNWTPETERVNRVEKEVFSLEDGNIRGGHWILNKEGKSATIAFLFKKSSGRIYGLTVGHLEELNEPLFVFLRSEPTVGVSYNNDTDLEEYEVYEVGEVVSKDEDTDSLLFEVTREDVKDRFDLLQLAPESGLGDRTLALPTPTLGPLPPQQGTEYWMYGAFTRGARLIVSSPTQDDPSEGETNLFPSDIGFGHWNDPKLRISQNGDCGALYLESPSGRPLAVHHVSARYHREESEKPDAFEGFGTPVSLIMAKHPEQFDKEMFGAILRGSSGENNAKQSESDTSVHHSGQVAKKFESRQFKYFDVKLFKGNIRDASRRPTASGPPTAAEREASLSSRKDATRTESRQLAYFNVSVSKAK